MAPLVDLMNPLPGTSARVPRGAMRIKGLVHTDRGWRIVEADPDGTRFSPTVWRGDSQLERIASPHLDVAGVEAALLRQLRPDSC